MSMGVNGSWGGSVSGHPPIPPEFHSHLTPNTDLGVAFFLIVTGVVSVLGNGTVLLVFCKNGKKLRPPELMTVNLAVCDFGYSLLGAPFLIISSLSHAWVFGESGCLWYGMQGFVFGVGSLITTCVISLDRCLKICCFTYGQWIERRHMSVAIGLVWTYTLFWATLPAFGFGSYGPEPFGTSCTINWWRMRSSLGDRVYIALIMTLCFGVPTLAIVISYLAILLAVYRSNRALASFSSSAATKDLRLTKVAAVVCSSFLLAWTPYTIVSLYSALAPGEEREGGGALHPSGILDLPSLLNWTSAESYDSDPLLSTAADATRSSPAGHRGAPETESYRSMSRLPPTVTLIPAMFAKSHCMINPFIYQIMNREFREDVYGILFGREMGERRKGARAKEESYCES